MPERERFILTLEAAPDGDGPMTILRLRRLLKFLLRNFGFRCVEIYRASEEPKK